MAKGRPYEDRVKVDYVDADVPVGVVDLLLTAEELHLAGLVGEVTTNLVAVLLSLEERSQVHAGPHLLTGEFPIADKKRLN